MKKLALTSLLAVFAASGAQAANVINNNPLYRPMAGQFYSVTDLGTDSDNTSRVALGEEFGYGITDRLAATVLGAVSESNWFDNGGMDYIGVGLNYRLVDMGNWKGDVFGSYKALNIGTWGDDSDDKWFDEDDMSYTWTAGMRGGYVAECWTVAGHFAFDYNNNESFNWNDGKRSSHIMRFGLDGQLMFSQEWNVTAGVEYNMNYDKWSENTGYWTGKLGANYNFDANKFLGAYISKIMNHTAAGKWDVDDGFGFGATFGIQF
ncbi:hypothetical protein HDR61_04725 [bacterium]|nr:hypothetical protein [bacterium]